MFVRKIRATLRFFLFSVSVRVYYCARLNSFEQQSVNLLLFCRNIYTNDTPDQTLICTQPSPISAVELSDAVCSSVASAIAACAAGAVRLMSVTYVVCIMMSV